MIHGLCHRGSLVLEQHCSSANTPEAFSISRECEMFRRAYLALARKYGDVLASKSFVGIFFGQLKVWLLLVT